MNLTETVTVKDREPEESQEGGHCRGRNTGQGGLPGWLLPPAATPGLGELPEEVRCDCSEVAASRQTEVWAREERPASPGLEQLRAGGARGGKVASAVLTVTDVRLVMVFLRGGVVPPPATCGATGLGRHGNSGVLVTLTVTVVPQRVLCKALSASPGSPYSTLYFTNLYQPHFMGQETEAQRG